MKSVLTLFLLLVSVAFTKAQNIVEDSSSQSHPVNRNQELRGYYIEGLRVVTTNTPVFMGCGIDMPVYKIGGTTTFSRQQLMNLPQRNVNSIAGTVAGVDSRNGEIPNIRGARQDGTAYYVDGIRIIEPYMAYDCIK